MVQTGGMSSRVPTPVLCDGLSTIKALKGGGGDSSELPLPVAAGWLLISWLHLRVGQSQIPSQPKCSSISLELSHSARKT